MSFDIKTKGMIPQSWHVNNKKPQVYPGEIDWLQADGDELEQIRMTFQNIPYTHRICLWRGEMAQFIYDNL